MFARLCNPKLIETKNWKKTNSKLFETEGQTDSLFVYVFPG